MKGRKIYKKEGKEVRKRKNKGRQKVKWRNKIGMRQPTVRDTEKRGEESWKRYINEGKKGSTTKKKK